MFLFIFFVIVISTIAQEEKFISTFEFEELCKEYLRLTLVEDLWKANEKTYTRKGREWLRVWRETRDSIFKKLIFFKDTTINEYKLFSNWPERIDKFEKIKESYYHSILIYPISYENLPWPKITFDPELGKTIVQPLSQYKLKIPHDMDNHNPVASKKQIDEVLKFYKPFSEDEKKLAKEVHENREKESIADGTFHSDLACVNLSPEAKNYYRSLLKKYSVISEKKIDKLVKARYELLKKNFQNKRLSDLHYEKAIINVNRITSELKLWDKKFIFRDVTDEIFFTIMPMHLRIINSDKAYRGYLNADETFFPGNTMYGFKNRYDDPSQQLYVKDLGFEITAEKILRSAYNPMLKLAIEIRELEISSNDFKQLKIKDLSKIDLLLERYELWTFWKDQWRFSDYQWFTSKFPGSFADISMHMIVPLKLKLTSENIMLLEVQKILDEAKNIPLQHQKSLVLNVNKYSIGESIKDLSKNQNFFPCKKINQRIIWKISNIVNSLRITKSLSVLTSQSSLKKSLSSQNQKLSFQNNMKSNNQNNENNKKDETFDKKKNTDFDQFAASFRNNFNLESINHILSHEEPESMQNFISVSDLSNSQHNYYGTGGDIGSRNHHSQYSNSRSHRLHN